MTDAVLTWTVSPPANDGPLATRNPKADQIKAIKLTDDNVQEVAGYILKTIGGKVEVESLGNAGLAIYVGGTYLARVGYWLTETYDYVNGTPVFHMAVLADREKYDLR